MEEGIYTLAAVLLGGAISTITSWLITRQQIKQIRLDREHRLSLVAAEKRLEIHQEAYNRLLKIWRLAVNARPEIMKSHSRINPGPKIKELTQEIDISIIWMESNSFYLAGHGSVAEAFERTLYTCYDIAFSRVKGMSALVGSPDWKEWEKDRRIILNGLNMVRQAVALPDLKDIPEPKLHTRSGNKDWATQWDDDDFKPIFAEFEKLFTKLGWNRRP